MMMPELEQAEFLILLLGSLRLADDDFWQAMEFLSDANKIAPSLVELF